MHITPRKSEKKSYFVINLLNETFGNEKFLTPALKNRPKLWVSKKILDIYGQSSKSPPVSNSYSS